MAQQPRYNGDEAIANEDCLGESPPQPVALIPSLQSLQTEGPGYGGLTKAEKTRSCAQTRYIRKAGRLKHLPRRLFGMLKHIAGSECYCDAKESWRGRCCDGGSQPKCCSMCMCMCITSPSLNLGNIGPFYQQAIRVQAECEEHVTLKCSATSQDSKAEYSREVATPQKILPTSRMWKLFQCFVKQPKTYVATYVNAAFFLPLQEQMAIVNPRPSAMVVVRELAEVVRLEFGHTYLRSAKLPTKVPMIMEEPKPAMKS